MLLFCCNLFYRSNIIFSIFKHIPCLAKEYEINDVSNQAYDCCDESQDA